MPDNPDDWPERLQAELRQLIERYGFYEFEEVSAEIISVENRRLDAEKEALRAARAEALKPYVHEIDRIIGPSPANPNARSGGGLTVGQGRGIARHRLEEFVLKHGRLPD